MTKAKPKESIYNALNNKENVKNFKQEIKIEDFNDDKYSIFNGHFSDYRFNIFNGKMDDCFIKMFNDGDGNELVAKACAFHSSSMLAYNFFHWIKEPEATLEIQWDTETKIVYNDVFFEVKLPVLKSSPRCSNMDVLLTNDNRDFLFIESKFLEYTNKGDFEFAKSYLSEKDKKTQKENYYSDGKKWVSFINSMLKSKAAYCSGIKQEICHLIALTNWLNGNTTFKLGEKMIDNKAINDVRFINLVFEPLEDKFREHEKFSGYFDRYKKLLEQLDNEDNKKLIPSQLRNEKMCFQNYSFIWNQMKENLNNNKELLKYLWYHYMQFAEGAENYEK